VSGSLHIALDAVVLPRPAAAGAIIQAWEAGRAVLPLDPAAPAPATRRLLDVSRPTHLVDADGRRRLPGGRPVAAQVAAVVATSGTAGTPKAVELTAAGLRAASLATSAALGAGPGDRWLACVPLHGVAGLAIVARSWHTGVPLTVQEGFDEALVEEAASHGATLVSLVPTMLRRLLAAGSDLRAFRRILLGGGPVPPDLLTRAAELELGVVTTYGLTETCGGVVHNGHPLDGVTLAVGGPDSELARSRALGGGQPSDSVNEGEIRIRGPMVMRGYHDDQAATDAALRGGWLHTGDQGRLAPNGRLLVLGRRDDLIISGGVNVHPVEVERVLAGHPGVRDVAVAGAPDPEWGQRVVAFVVPAQPADPPSLDQLRGFVRQRLAAAKAPRDLVLVAELPRSPSGKLLRRRLPTTAPLPP
jgi:o-succinylbenzoate---CoA ligase